MSGDIERDIGRLEAKVEAVEGQLREVQADLKKVLECINKTKGVWKLLLLIVTGAGAAGALAAKVMGLWTLVKPG